MLCLIMVHNILDILDIQDIRRSIGRYKGQVGHRFNRPFDRPFNNFVRTTVDSVRHNAADVAIGETGGVIERHCWLI
jgi:hypothetical protein